MVLHTLRDRLTVAETADLGAQLPMLIRGIYYDGWMTKPMTVNQRKIFLRHIAAAFQDEAEVFAEEVVWAVFKMLQRHVSAGEIKDVKQILPAEIRSLWPGTPGRPGS